MASLHQARLSVSEDAEHTSRSSPSESHSDSDSISDPNIHNVQDETDIDLQHQSVYCFGDSLNEIQIYLFFIELYEQLLTINVPNLTEENKRNDSLDDYVDKCSPMKRKLSMRCSKNLNQNHLDENIKHLTKYLKSMDLFRVTLRPRTLQLLYDIITICGSSLKCIDFELQIRESNLVPIKYHKHSTKITKTMSRIYRRKSEQIIRQNSIITNDQYDDEIKFIFDTLMNKLHTLPQLQDFSMDIVNFPVSCYDYFRYFRYDSTQQKCSFYNLKDVHLNLGNKEMLKYKDMTSQHLYEWILHHKHLKKLAIKVIDYEDWALLDENARLIHKERFQYKQRFTLKYEDRQSINKIITTFIRGLMQNKRVLNQLNKFYFHDEISGIYDFKDILIDLFEHRTLQQIEWIHLSFNDMRDLYLNQIVSSMLKSQYIHKNLAYLTFSWLNSCDKNWRFPVWNERFMNNDDYDYDESTTFYHGLQNHRADFLCGLKHFEADEEKENKSHLTVEDVFSKSMSWNAIHNPHSVKNDTVSFKEKIIIKNEWKEMHFAQADSTLQTLSKLIKNCSKLTSLTLKCFYGVCIADFAALIDTISKHSVIDDLQIHALQSRKELIKGLQSLFVNKNTFIQQCAILFIKHFPKTLKTEYVENNIDSQSLFKLIDVVVDNQTLFRNCCKNITNTLLTIGYAQDVTKIIINYIFDVDQLNIELYGLFNMVKQTAIQYLGSKQKHLSNNNDLAIMHETTQDMDLNATQPYCFIKRQLRFNDFN